jgi:hypothetical protein
VSQSEVSSIYSSTQNQIKPIEENDEFPTKNNDLGIEEYLENSMYRDIMGTRPQAPKQENQYTLMKEESVRLDSAEYLLFIDELTQKALERSPDSFICLACWRYISYYQQR